MTNKIKTQSVFWKNNKDINTLFNIFGNKNIKIVGGAVRRAIKNEITDDIDLAVKSNPKDVQELLKKNNIKFTDKSKGHGTISIFSKECKIEVTSLRKDIITDGRRAKVEFTKNFKEDSERRDFTINAIYSDLHGNLYDPQNGLNDLKQNIIRYIGAPEKRILEDKLRILRYFRMLSIYSYDNKQIDKNSLEASVKKFSNIKLLSKERVTIEIKKLILSNNVCFSLNYMKEFDLLDYLIKGLQKIKKSDLYNIKKLPDDVLTRIAYLILKSKVKILDLNKYMQISKQELKDLKNVFKVKYNINTIEQAKKIKYLYGEKVALIHYNLFNFDKNRKESIEITKVLNYWKPPKLPLNGNDVLKYKKLNGKEIGNILKKLENWWIKKNFIPNKNDLLKKLGSYYSTPRS